MNIVEDLRSSVIEIICGLYIMQLLFTNTNPNYILIYILSLVVIGYKIYEKTTSKVQAMKTSNEFEKEIVQITEEHDKIFGNMPKKYLIAQTLIRSDQQLWTSLKSLKPYEKVDESLYDEILSNLVTFYQQYGKFLVKVKYVDNDLTTLITMRNKVMNSFEHMNMKLEIKYVQNIVKLHQISSVVFISMNRAVRIISKKYKKDYNIAPLPSNLTGTKNELF